MIVGHHEGRDRFISTIFKIIFVQEHYRQDHQREDQQGHQDPQGH